MQLNMQRLRPYIQDVESLLLNAWNIGHTEPKKPKQAIIEFSYQIFTHAQDSLYRSLPDKAEIILMEDFLINEYSCQKYHNLAKTGRYASHVDPRSKKGRHHFR